MTCEGLVAEPEVEAAWRAEFERAGEGRDYPQWKSNRRHDGGDDVSLAGRRVRGAAA